LKIILNHVLCNLVQPTIHIQVASFSGGPHLAFQILLAASTHNR